jgi:cytochrome c-type biogenesis protein CcmE
LTAQTTETLPWDYDDGAGRADDAARQYSLEVLDRRSVDRRRSGLLVAPSFGSRQLLPDDRRAERRTGYRPSGDLKISGAVDGETISYDAQTLTLRFVVANVPGDLDEIEQAGGLAAVLHQAVTNPDASRLTVEYIVPKPDLLRHEAQAIVTGRMGEDGVFHADELLLKCPTRYEESVPQQAES